MIVSISNRPQKETFIEKKIKSQSILISILTDYKQENIENKNFQTYTKPILSSFVNKQMTPDGFFLETLKMYCKLPLSLKQLNHIFEKVKHEGKI